MDLQKVYEILEEEQRELQKFYEVLRPTRSIVDGEITELECELENFLEFVGLAKNSETLLAAINRIVNLREDLLLQVIADYDEAKKIEVRQRAYVWVSRFYLARFERLLKRIKKYLSPFYATLLHHAHRIGEVFSGWHTSWMVQIVHGINQDLLRQFNGDEARIMEMLREKGLLDRGHEGEIADRCYSVLRMREDGSFERLPYALAFKEEVQEAAKRLHEAIEDLYTYEDDIYHQKEEWLAYLQALKAALEEENIDQLVPKWADVDRAWMKITTPLQIGHPLEYYEDHFRKAVALEWDVRISDPSYRSTRSNAILSMFLQLYANIGIEKPSIFEQTIQNLKKTQLYVGRPLLFYGSEFNGLFSAQVVPNDEVVSKELGKKIFAYPDMVLATQRAKPKMKLGSIVYGKELYEHFRRVLDMPKIWHRVYDISTIGHEFGHILWMDERSETEMNASGQFKNLEEFKATCGGLVSYFMHEDEDLWEFVLEDTLTRAVSLIGWMEVDEVRPYYVEGLLHLAGLFESGVFFFDGKLHVALYKEIYWRLKEWYIRTYKELAEHYLLQKDAKEFLERYVSFGSKIMPKDEQVRDFVEYYYDLYRTIGAQIEG